MIFDGDDDSNSVNDNYYYVSMIVNDNWRVVRYDKANIQSRERKRSLSNNSGQTAQPTSLEALYWVELRVKSYFTISFRIILFLFSKMISTKYSPLV